MPANIEIKARVHDFNDIRGKAKVLSDAREQVIPQVDTFFYTEKGRLKLRELGQDRAQLVFYERANQGGPKRSDYQIFETNEPDTLKTTLTLALGIRGIVRKTRYLYLVGQTRVHLDDVEGLGKFMELEVVLRPDQSDEEGQAIALDLMSKLGVEETDLLEGAYMDLMENDEKKADNRKADNSQTGR
jgi:predicted adenylyl cyclase CyaB